MLKQVLACSGCVVLFQLEAQPHSSLLSAFRPAVCAVVEVALHTVLHTCTHWHYTHTCAAPPFLGCPERRN